MQDVVGRQFVGVSGRGELMGRVPGQGESRSVTVRSGPRCARLNAGPDGPLSTSRRNSDRCPVSCGPAVPNVQLVDRSARTGRPGRRGGNRGRTPAVRCRTIRRLQVAGDLQVDADPRPGAIPAGGGRHFHPQADGVGVRCSAIGRRRPRTARCWPRRLWSALCRSSGPAVMSSTLLTSRSQTPCPPTLFRRWPGRPLAAGGFGGAELETATLAGPVVVGRGAPQLQARPAHRQTQEFPQAAGSLHRTLPVQR